MLLIAVTISGIAAYYSVIGLTAIFAASVIPVMVMGAALEAGKIMATVWLHNNWDRASWQFKAYLIPAVMFLMFLTSMGIFGFLSKAHTDQAIPSGDAVARVEMIDTKIKTDKDNIAASQTQLKQLDDAISALLSGSASNATRDNNRTAQLSAQATKLRESQKKERQQIADSITKMQQEIASLNEQRAPLAAAVRKIDAEVGPIKYVAALIYGDHATENTLEAAVRWVIILIVVVFDPLALCLILAANKQMEWAHLARVLRKQGEKAEIAAQQETSTAETQLAESLQQITDISQRNTQLQAEATATGERIADISKDLAEAESLILHLDQQLQDTHLGWAQARDVADDLHHDLADLAAEHVRLEEELAENNRIHEDLLQGLCDAQELLSATEAQRDRLIQQLDDIVLPEAVDHTPLLQQISTLEQQLSSTRNDLAQVESHRNELQEQKSVAVYEERIAELTGWVDQLQNDLVAAVQLAQERNERLNELLTTREPDAQPIPQAIPRPTAAAPVPQTVPFTVGKPTDDLDAEEESGNADFGTAFPTQPSRGDLFLRVDYLPPVLFKWNSAKWIEIDRHSTDRLAYNETYIKHLINKLGTGEYEIDDLNDIERAEVSSYLNGSRTV